MRYSFIQSGLLAVCLAVAGWVGKKTAESGERIAALSNEVASLREAVGKVEKKLDEAMPRREFEARMELAERRLREVESRMSKVERLSP